MAYRNGTYVAFHAEGTNVPTDSDIKYFNMMKAWAAKSDDEFTMVNSHEKTAAVRDSSKKATLKASLQERLRNSKNMVLIIGETTKLDRDWVPFEIKTAVDTYKIPIIAAYTEYKNIMDPGALSHLWPGSLADRIKNKQAKVIHVPFRKEPLSDAIGQFDLSNLPKTSLNYYNRKAYEEWGLL